MTTPSGRRWADDLAAGPPRRPTAVADHPCRAGAPPRASDRCGAPSEGGCRLIACWCRAAGRLDVGTAGHPAVLRPHAGRGRSLDGRWPDVRTVAPGLDRVAGPEVAPPA